MIHVVLRTCKGIVVGALAFSTLSALTALAQIVPAKDNALGGPVPPSNAPATNKPTSGKKTRLVYPLGDYFEQHGDIKTLQGHVKITSEETVFTSDLATYNEKTAVAVSPGKLKVEDPDNILTGNTGTAFYKTRDIKIRENVTIVIKPRRKDQNAPEGSSRRKFKDPVTVTCSKVDYNWRTKIADMTGDLTFKQTTRTVTADRAIYDGNTETLTLIGNVHYVRSDINEKGDVDKAILVLKEGAENFKGFGIKNAVTVLEDEEETPTKPAPANNENPVPNRPDPTTPPVTPPTVPPVEPGAPPTNPAGTPATSPTTPAQPATPGTEPGTTPTTRP